MAHIAKYKAGAIGHILAHNDRSKSIPGDHVDPARTHLNYNLAAADQPLPQLEFIHQKLNECKRNPRKDSVVLCDVLVTTPKDLMEKELKKFFQSVYDCLSDRYGLHNVVSAWVHMDETTPHLHFAFVPVKSNRFTPPKLCAKEIITRRDLQTLHIDLKRHVERDLGHDVGILNAATRDGNRTITELKRETELAKQAEFERQTEQAALAAQKARDLQAAAEKEQRAAQFRAMEAAREAEQAERAAEAARMKLHAAERDLEARRMGVEANQAFSKANPSSYYLNGQTGEITGPFQKKGIRRSLDEVINEAKAAAAADLQNQLKQLNPHEKWQDRTDDR